MKRLLYILLTIILVVFAVVLTTANLNEVTFNYLIGDINLSLIWIILAAFTMGALLSMIVFFVMLLKQQRQIKRLEHSKKLVQKELDNLRQLRSDITE